MAQTGARRAYAVPAILEDEGMLEAFYTNIAGNLGLGSLLAPWSSLPFAPHSLSRLANRKVPERIRKKTSTFPLPGVAFGVGKFLGSQDRTASFRRHLRYSDDLGRAMVRKGFGDATHIYSMLGECGPLLAMAKARGLKVVSEVYILLSTERILAEERLLFPDWEPDIPDYAAIRREVGDDDALLRFTDYFICPSEAVRDDLMENFAVRQEQTTVVPYGVGPAWFAVPNEPIPGRILFAGTAELRKGIHYLARAAALLAEGGHHYEFRVAGNVAPSIATREDCRHLRFLGRLPRDQIREEFRRADLFVLPSLAEGSAEAIYEALAAGLPVVATRSTGSVLRDRQEGRLVPERDAEALAEAIEEIISDRVMRDRMARSGKERAYEFTWERYGERLLTALRSLK